VGRKLFRSARGGDLQEATVVSALKDRELRTAIELLSGSLDFAIAERGGDSGVKLRKNRFKRLASALVRLSELDLYVLHG
jgi:hypothetical protein